MRGFLSAVIGAGLVAAAACGSAGRDQRPAVPAVAVRTVRAETRTIAERLEAGGTVAATEAALVTSRIVAPVLSVHVRAGDRVHAGDVLLTLDGRNLAAQARQAQAESIAAERALAQVRDDQIAAAADLKLASAWHGRIAGLHARDSATGQEFDEAEARLSAAKARASAIESAVEQAMARIDGSRAAADAAAVTESFATIRAPFDGVVTERLTDPGNLAAPGTPLLRMEANGAQHVDLRVDEGRARFVHPGDRVGVVLDSRSGDSGDDELDGMVVEVARAVAADDRAFTVKVSLPAGVSATSGSFARVRVRGNARMALMIPADAVRRQGQVASVFVAPGGVARLRLVQTGVSDAGDIEVLAGLDPGEVVIAAPPAALTDGRQITVSGTGSVGGRR